MNASAQVCLSSILPAITTAEAALSRRLGRRSDPLRLPFDGGEILVRCDPVATIRAIEADAEPGATLAFEVRLPDGAIGLEIPAPAARRLLALADAAELDPASPLGALALNLGLDLVLSRIEEATRSDGLSIALADPASRPVMIRGVLCLQVELDDGDKVPVRLMLPASMWENFVDHLGAAGYTGPPLDCPVEIVIELAALWLPVRRLERLRPGDVVLPDDPPIKAGRAAAIIGGRLCVALAVEGARAGVLAPPTRFQARDKKRMHPMQDHDATPDASPGDIDIRLAFELGRQTLPYSAVNRLAPGYVFELAKEPGTAVDIVANGARIGAGEIVIIGDLVGVRVTRMFGHE